MAVHGDLDTMPLVELLQWASVNRKTGVLELERNKICRKIRLRKGRIVGCSSDDPSNLLGQFLISRGAITARTLHYALRHQKKTGQGLPEIFADMGVLTDEEVAEHIASKALETIYGLFEWKDAIFRFDNDTASDRYTIEVDLSIDHTLLSGAQRQDDLGRIRGVFTGSNIVLRRTDRPLSSALENGPLAVQVLDLVDGEHSLAEILLRSHASEFDVLMILLDLHSDGNVEIAGERSPDKCGTTLIDVAPDEASMPLPETPEFEGLEEEQPAEGAVKKPKKRVTDLYVLLQAASYELEHGDYEAALTVLDTCYALKPHDESVKRLIHTAEVSYLKWAHEGILGLDRIPVRTVSIDEAPPPLKPVESILLGMIDGATSIQELIWIVSLREVELMRALHKLHTTELIRFEENAESCVEQQVGLDLYKGAPVS